MYSSRAICTSNHAAATQHATRAPRVHQRTLVAIVIVVGLVYAAVIALSVRHYGDNLSSLIDVGQLSVQSQPGSLGHHVVVFRNSRGYDGQTYYWIAGDPFLQHPTDRDAFRYQRIGYPIAIWAVSLDQREWRPVAMVAINMVSVMAVAYLSGLIIALFGGGTSVWWALACAINPSLIISVQLDLAEPMATALSIGGLLLFRRRHIGWAALVFAAALLTREVAILFIVPVIIAELVRRRIVSAVALAATVIPYFVWEYILDKTFGTAGTAGSASNFGAPFAGIGTVISAARHAGLRAAIVHDGSVLAVVLIVLVALIVAIAYMFRNPDVFLGSIIAHGVAAIFAASGIWIAFSSAARVFGGLYPPTIFSYARHRSPAFAVLAAAIVLLTVFTFIRLVAITPVVPYYLTP